jgi:hyperosmotically inducible protein
MLTRLFLVGVLVVMPSLTEAAAFGDTLARRVEAKIRAYPHFTIFDDISVSANGQRITLAGRVTEPFKRVEIEARAAKVEGVKDVVNNIRVLPTSFRDADLRVRIAKAIYSHPSFWRYAAMASPPIHIIVEAGNVTLVGTVDTESDRTLAFALAQVPGTFGVTNNLKTPGVDSRSGGAILENRHPAC